MKINKLWILALLAISFTGCYTSFAPRDYEQESYGKFNEDYYNQPEVAENYDSLDFLDEDYLYSDPQVITINNNYPPDWAWDYYSPSYVSVGYCNWGGFYDPFYDPYWGPYYGRYNNPYYGGNIYVYGDAYFGGSYGSSYYPSQTRYRTTRSHWTNLRDNGGRKVASRDGRTNGRGGRGTIDKRNGGTTRTREIKGFDLDRDLRVTRNSGSGSVSRTRKTGLRNASIRKSGEVKTARRKTDLERRRISNRTKEQVVRNKPKRNSESQRVTKRSKVQNRSRSAARTETRSKRTYSSSGTSKSRNSRGSSRSYHPPSSRSSNRSSNVTQSQRNSGASRSNSSSRSSYRASRPSVSRSSSSSSRSSGSSSSRSSGSSSRSSSKSSRGRR